LGRVATGSVVASSGRGENKEEEKPVDMAEFTKIPCVIQRGGTSKGIYIHAKDLPTDPAARDRVILAIFGSPDKRQIDGLGGADSLTSKVAIIAPSAREDSDVDYTFGAVDLTEPIVDYRGNCGNLSAGVGPFALDEGLVAAREGETVVRIFNTNTQKCLRAYVPTSGGKAKYAGDYAIAGVPGTGAKILLDYAGTSGAATGKILPTGNRIDLVSIPSLGTIEMSIVDAGNPVCFIRPSAMGLSGTEGPIDKAVLAILDTVELIRGTAARIIGMVENEKDARIESPAMPLLALVAEPQGYVKYTDGRSVDASEIDLVARVFYMQEMHKTYSVTAAVCTGTAAMIDGTIVNQAVSAQAAETGTVRIGHPGGVLPIEVEVNATSRGLELKKAALGRTSRRIMDGFVYVPEALYTE
jgi:2-methylaconitate cis-trans-isomerase PrpF